MTFTATCWTKHRLTLLWSGWKDIPGLTFPFLELILLPQADCSITDSWTRLQITSNINNIAAPESWMWQHALARKCACGQGCSHWKMIFKPEFGIHYSPLPGGSSEVKFNTRTYTPMHTCRENASNMHFILQRRKPEWKTLNYHLRAADRIIY